MKNIERVEQMPIYQLFFELAIQVEKATRGFGTEFRWLRVQSLKSSESPCANMTEGFYAQYSTEYLQALFRSRREARELLTHIHYAVRIGQLGQFIAVRLADKYEEALRQLSMLIRSVERKIREYGKHKPDKMMMEEAGVPYGDGGERPSLQPSNH
jgi:four helix bundle protein